MQQLRFLRRAIPIEQAIEQTNDPARRDLLQLVLDVRVFAAANGMEPDGSYAKVSNTEGLALVHVVTAALQHELKPYVWRYPIVGAIPYRGYFDVGSARELAEDLRGQGYDTMIVEAGAYSTLGWFSDPLPSSLLDRDRVTLVITVLHELAHQRLFVRSDIAFNETFANVAGLRAAIRFFEERGETDDADEVARRYRGWLERGVFFDRLAGELEAFFAGEPPRETLLFERKALYEKAQQEYREKKLGYPTKGDFSVEEMDNARFLAIYRYSKRSGEFDRFFRSFASVSEALDGLEARVKETDDPYRALALE